MKIRFTTLITVLTLIFFTNCNRNDDTDPICTTEFKIITITVVNKNSEKVVLDSFKVINKNNGEDVTVSETIYSLELAQELGEYPLVADGSIAKNSSREMTFFGFIDSNEVIRSDYLAEEGTCGVHLLSGEVRLILE